MAVACRMCLAIVAFGVHRSLGRKRKGWSRIGDGGGQKRRQRADHHYSSVEFKIALTD